MSKCREAFEIANSGKNLIRNPTHDCYADPDLWKPWRDWQAAWNAATKNAIDCCTDFETESEQECSLSWAAAAHRCAEAILKEIEP